MNLGEYQEEQGDEKKGACGRVVFVRFVVGAAVAAQAAQLVVVLVGAFVRLLVGAAVAVAQLVVPVVVWLR